MSNTDQIVVKKINDHSVRAIKTATTLDTRPVKGADLIANVFANICIIGRKFVGKTTSLFKILWHCIGKDTTVILFVGTVLNDDSWIETLTKLKKHNIANVVHQSTYEGKGKHKTNVVEDLIDAMRQGVPLAEKPKQQELEKEDKPTESKESKEDDAFASMFGATSITETKEEEPENASEKLPEPVKAVRGKYNYPKYFIVFDDISSELKNPAISTLLKQNRHYKSKIAVSTQYYHDLLPDARKQMQVFMIFKGQPLEKLKIIYQDADIGIPFDVFTSIYEDATSEPYSFLYIDKDRQTFRKGFNYEYTIPKGLAN